MARPRPPVPPFPSAREREYQRQLLRRTRAAQQLLFEALGREGITPRRGDGSAPLLLPARRWQPLEEGLILAPAELDARLQARADSFAPGPGDPLEYGDEDRIVRVVARVERAFEEALPPDTEEIAKHGVQLDLFAARTLRQQIKTVYGIDPGATPLQRERIARWTAANVDLITSIDQRYFADIGDAVIRTVRKGGTTRDLVKSFKERYNVSRSRARLIARDQISKLNGEITESRQTEIGIYEYDWSTSGDERVRESHRDNDGQRFAWASPPSETGHPGQDYQCRCVALPVFPEQQQALLLLRAA